MDDPLSYFIVFLGKDQELDGLTISVQYGIYDIVAYEHFDKTEHDLFNIMEKKNEEPMIMKSQNNNARPMEIFLYLFTIAPTISVPPVLPFAEKTSPRPAPQRNAPIIMDMNGWSCRSGCPFRSHSKNDKEADREKLRKLFLSEI